MRPGGTYRSLLMLVWGVVFYPQLVRFVYFPIIGLGK